MLMMKRELWALCLMVPFFLFSQVEKKYHAYKDGITLDYSYNSKTEKIAFEVRLETTASINKLKSVALNADDYKYWYYRVSECKNIYQNNRHYALFVMDLPWPFTDREQVILFNTKRAENGEWIYLRSAINEIPKSSQNIRTKGTVGTWQFYTNANGKNQVIHKVQNVETVGIPWIFIQSEFEKGLFYTASHFRKRAESL